MLYAADVLVDRQPVVHRLAVHRHRRARAAEAGEVPRGIDEGVHRLGVALARTAALATVRLLPGGVMHPGISRPGDSDVFGPGQRNTVDKIRGSSVRKQVFLHDIMLWAIVKR